VLETKTDETVWLSASDAELSTIADEVSEVSKGDVVDSTVWLETTAEDSDIELDTRV
jgi:hypothetical protein